MYLLSQKLFCVFIWIWIGAGWQAATTCNNNDGCSGSYSLPPWPTGGAAPPILCGVVWMVAFMHPGQHWKTAAVLAVGSNVGFSCASQHLLHQKIEKNLAWGSGWYFLYWVPFVEIGSHLHTQPLVLQTFFDPHITRMKRQRVTQLSVPQSLLKN